MAGEPEQESATVELLKRIRKAFDIFDHESNRTVDVREIGTIVRSLNCCPSEGDVNDIINEVEEDEPTGYIRFEKFEPAMMRIMLERKYRSASEEQLRKAFEVLDIEKKEHLTPEELQAVMSEEGEPFTQDELEELLSAAVDPDKELVFYNDFISSLAVDDDGSW